MFKMIFKTWSLNKVKRCHSFVFPFIASSNSQFFLLGVTKLYKQNLINIQMMNIKDIF